MLRLVTSIFRPGAAASSSASSGAASATREPGLPRTTRAGQGVQPDALAADQGLYRRYLLFAAHQRVSGTGSAPAAGTASPRARYPQAG